MRKEKRERLARAGWKVGDAKDFLGLSDADSALVEIRVALADQLKRRRLARNLSQVRFAERLGSSQSRVAKMEAGDRSVSLDLLLRSLFALKVPKKEIAKAIASA